MAIKLLATDLDDTLLNDQFMVSQQNKEAIFKAVEQGVIVTIATGRMFSSALPFAKQLGINVPIITYNGALVKYCNTGEVLFEQPIDPEVVGEILELFREKNWYIHLYVNDILYVKEHCEKAQGYEKLAGIKAEVVGDKIYDFREGILKMLAIAEPEQMKEVAKTVQTTFKGRVFAPQSKENYLEIVDPNINKAIALDFLAKKLNVRQEEVMAIGDSNNDLDMIKYAGFGVEMGNAFETVKAVADVVTCSNEESGVAAAIEKFILQAK